MSASRNGLVTTNSANSTNVIAFPKPVPVNATEADIGPGESYIVTTVATLSGVTGLDNNFLISNSNASFFGSSSAGSMQTFQPPTNATQSITSERVVTVDKVARVASITAAIISFVALLAFFLTGVVLIHPFLAFLTALGAAFFYMMTMIKEHP